MKLDITWRQAAEIMQGNLVSSDPSAAFNSFVTDTRAIKQDDIFWALKGKTYDANNFLAQAVEKGAAGLVAEKTAAARLAKKPAHIIETDDTLKALERLALFHRMRFNIPVAAVTGSNGKSTTKEMLRAIMASKAETCANKGNLNNQFGVPFSVLEMGPQHGYAIFELGASQKGDIQQTANVVRPDAGIITNISPAHLEFFGDMETIYSTKTEMAQCLNSGGTLVYNTDDQLLMRLKKTWKGKSLTFGFSQEADIRAESGEGILRLRHAGKIKEINITPLRHNRLNAAAAAAGAIALGISWDSVITGLESYTPMPMRMQIEIRGKAKIILDAYNANPASMRAALEILSSEPARPRVAIIGDMKELGQYSAQYHAEIATFAAALNLDRIFLGGPEMQAGYEAAVKAGMADKISYQEDIMKFSAEISSMLSAGGTYLLKASRSMGFEKILEKL